MGCFVVANEPSVEAGLFATTVMGVVVANQRLAPVAHIAAFGEDLGVLLLGGLFIVLGSTIEFDAMRSMLLPGLALLVMLLAARPVAVWLSALGSSLAKPDRHYLSLIAPKVWSQRRWPPSSRCRSRASTSKAQHDAVGWSSPAIRHGRSSSRPRSLPPRFRRWCCALTGITNQPPTSVC